MNCTVQELAGRLGIEFVGNGDVHIEGVNTLEHAGPHELSFLANPKYLDQVEATRAGAVILHPEHASRVETALLSTNPYLDFARVVQMFATPQGSFNGQSFMAFVHPEADVHESATIYPFAYVGAGAVIEAEVTLFSGVYVGEECRVGRGCILYPNAVLMARTTLGESVTLHPGAVVGSDGFGFAQAAAGFEKFPQIGRSVIEDGVEIGANTTIDRAALGESRVGKGTKIDNLVQLGHNVTVGENSIIVAQVGIAGSTTIGSNVILAGQVGIAGHLSIGDNVRIGAKSGVGRDIPPGTDMSGIPAMEHRRFLKVASLLNRLPEMSKRLRQLEIELAKVKEQGASDEHE